MTGTQETEAFGRAIGGTGGTANPFGYHGSEGYRQDGDGPQGLEPYQKVGARYYDATFGRFITRDTVLTQAPYAYCDGDPVNCSDPSGHLSAVNIASGGISASLDSDWSMAAGSASDWSDESSGSSSSSSTGSSTGGSGTDPGGSNPGGGSSGGSSGSGGPGAGNQGTFTPTKNGGYNITFNPEGPLSNTFGFNSHNSLTSVGGEIRVPVTGVPGLSVYGTGTVSLGTGNSSYIYGVEFKGSF